MEKETCSTILTEDEIKILCEPIKFEDLPEDWQDAIKWALIEGNLDQIVF